MHYSKCGLTYDLYSFEITSEDLYKTPLFIIPNIELALFLVIRHCLENFKSLDIIIPRSFSSSIDLTHYHSSGTETLNLCHERKSDSRREL